LEFIPVIHCDSDSDSYLLWIFGLPGHRNSCLHKAQPDGGARLATPW
jgi:hypothetical protein